MATQFKHSYKEFGADAVRKRILSMLAFRDEVNVEEAHVKFSTGNRKTGAQVPSVSLIPVADCGNCAICARGCYDVRNVCFQTTVQKARANNSAIFKSDPLKYFTEIKEYIIKKRVKFFRWHVGGDLKDTDYLRNVVDIALATPECQHLAFTKMYDLVNSFLMMGYKIPDNLHIIFSDWRGTDFDNPYEMPVSSPLWPDGMHGPHCTDKTFLCPGSCEECAANGVGCWVAGKGDTILFIAH